MSKLYCVLYLSVETAPFNDSEISELVVDARKQNQKYNITGFLYYKQQHFFQYIEGEKKTVERLLLNLKKDSRHQFVNCISDAQLTERRFTHWSMGNLKTNELIQIKLEDIIIDYLSWIKSYDDTSLYVDYKTAWGLIDKLAYFKNKGALSYVVE